MHTLLDIGLTVGYNHLIDIRLDWIKGLVYSITPLRSLIGYIVEGLSR